MSGWKLYLDDIRQPPYAELTLARSVREAQELIGKLGCPEFISFDHDLALDHYAPTDERYMKPSECLTGHDFAKWLVTLDLQARGTFFPENFRFYVHSMNPVGKENIQKYLDSYFEYKREVRGQ